MTESAKRGWPDPGHPAEPCCTLHHVRVRAMMPPGHIRTPSYLRGKVGVIERALGSFHNPEALAYRQPADPQPLFRVRFTMAELWGGTAEYAHDTLDADIYGHWLEPVAAGSDHAA